LMVAVLRYYNIPSINASVLLRSGIPASSPISKRSQLRSTNVHNHESILSWKIVPEIDGPALGAVRVAAGLDAPPEGDAARPRAGKPVRGARSAISNGPGSWKNAVVVERDSLVHRRGQEGRSDVGITTSGGLPGPARGDGLDDLASTYGADRHP